MGNVQSRSPQSAHTHSKQSTRGNFNLLAYFACLYHLFNPATWRSSSDEVGGICGSARCCRVLPFLRRILTAHRGEIVFLFLFESKSRFDKNGCKFFELLSFHSRVQSTVSSKSITECKFLFPSFLKFTATFSRNTFLVLKGFSDVLIYLSSNFQ